MTRPYAPGAGLLACPKCRDTGKAPAWATDSLGVRECVDAPCDCPAGDKAVAEHQAADAAWEW